MCLDLTQMIEDSQKDIVFQEVIGHSMVLMTDVFGNYVIQKLLDFGLPVHREALADVITNSMLDLTLQMYGCRVVQKAFDVLSERRQLVLLDKLRGNVMGCITDQNGNHVVQKCLEKVRSGITAAGWAHTWPGMNTFFANDAPRSTGGTVFILSEVTYISR